VWDKVNIVLGREDTDQLFKMPTLYPSYFPYQTQHAILCKAQCVLEECCFEFTQKWQPSILTEHAWDCPEAVELTEWMRLFAKRAGSFPKHAFTLSGVALTDALFATNKLRHTAVHRVRTTARGVVALIRAAIVVTEALQDEGRTSLLAELEFEIDSRIKAMELNKNVLEDTLNQELQVIQQQREELDRQERELISKTFRDDGDNKALIGLLLKESVDRIFNHDPDLAKQSTDTELKSDDQEANGIEATDPAPNPVSEDPM
jgi:hypothetical protein